MSPDRRPEPYFDVHEMMLDLNDTIEFVSALGVGALVVAAAAVAVRSLKERLGRDAE